MNKLTKIDKYKYKDSPEKLPELAEKLLEVAATTVSGMVDCPVWIIKLVARAVLDRPAPAGEQPVGVRLQVGGGGVKKRIVDMPVLTIFRDRYNDKICIYLGIFQTVSPLGFTEKSAKIYELEKDGLYCIAGYDPEFNIDAEVIGRIEPNGRYTKAGDVLGYIDKDGKFTEASE